MKSKNKTIKKYIQLWERIQSILDSHVHYLASATKQSDPSPKQKRPPIKNIENFNIIVSSLKKSMEGHYGALMRHNLNIRENDENFELPEPEIAQLVDNSKKTQPSPSQD